MKLKPVRSKKDISLDDDAATLDLDKSEEELERATAKQVKRISTLQQVFYADERYALLIKRLEAQEAMDAAALEGLYRFLAADLGLKLVDLAQLTRIAVTGKAASPPIFEVVSILGRAETLARLRAAEAAVGAGR